MRITVSKQCISLDQTESIIMQEILGLGLGLGLNPNPKLKTIHTPF